MRTGHNALHVGITSFSAIFCCNVFFGLAFGVSTFSSSFFSSTSSSSSQLSCCWNKQIKLLMQCSLCSKQKSWQLFPILTNSKKITSTTENTRRKLGTHGTYLHFLLLVLAIPFVDVRFFSRDWHFILLAELLCKANTRLLNSSQTQITHRMHYHQLHPSNHQPAASPAAPGGCEGSTRARTRSTLHHTIINHEGGRWFKASSIPRLVGKFEITFLGP